MCKSYEGPERGNIGRALLAAQSKPRHAQILVNALPTTAYIGDKIAAGLAKLGVKPCAGCNERKELLNGADRSVRKLLGR